MTLPGVTCITNKLDKQVREIKKQKYLKSQE